MSVVDRVRPLVEPVLTDLGLDLYDLEFTGGRLVVTVDRSGGVDLDTIALATRLIGRELDHADPIPGRYHLEVTSPGLERSLRTPGHFRRSLGTTVSVRTHPTDDVPRRVQGVLEAADDEAIVVRDAAGEAVRIPLERVDRAKTVFEWGPAPKPGSPGARQRPRSGAAPRPTQEADAS